MGDSKQALGRSTKPIEEFLEFIASNTMANFPPFSNILVLGSILGFSAQPGHERISKDLPICRIPLNFQCIEMF